MSRSKRAGRPVPFLDELVRKILAGEKDHTRRILRSKDFLEYGGVGDLLYVRETVRAEKLDGVLGLRYRADDAFVPFSTKYEDGVGWSEWATLYQYQGAEGRYVPPLHSPRWASRLTLRILETRVERIQAITREDAIREGVGRADGLEGRNPVARFRDLWTVTYGPHAWGRNDWVQVIAFDPIRKHIDEVIANGDEATRAREPLERDQQGRP